MNIIEVKQVIGGNMIYNYSKPSELLARQKQTGESYWDMIGKPLPGYRPGKDSINQHKQFIQTHRRNLWRYLVANNYPTTGLDNMIRQMAYESKYGTSNVAKRNHNYSGYGYNGKTYTNFKNDEAFYRAYVSLMKKMGAIGIQDTTKFARVLKNAGYYEDSFDNYLNNLRNMKQANTWINDEIKNNSKFYKEAQMKLSDFDLNEQTVAPVDNTNVVKPQIVPQTIPAVKPQQEQPTTYEPYNTNLPDLMKAYQAITSGEMPLQTLKLGDYGYDDYTEA